MKVRCIKTSASTTDKSIINVDMREYLKLGSLFWVYGINFSREVTYCYIFNEQHLFEVPLELFEIVDEKVPSSWAIRIQRNGDVTLWPELFYREGFLENFAEREIAEREEFVPLRELIEQ
jgi:hypothetical protein